MKKYGLFLAVLIGFVVFGLSSCGSSSSNSVFWEDWFYSKGYITTKQDPFENSKNKFDKFVKDNNPDSSISRSNYAICYYHSYDRKPRGSMTFYKWNPDTLEYDEMEDHRYQLDIDLEPDSTTIPGIIFYRDEEDVYIINNLYKFDLTLHTDKYSHADYYFEISLNGIRKHSFYMDKYTDKTNPFN